MDPDSTVSASGTGSRVPSSTVGLSQGAENNAHLNFHPQFFQKEV